jgi:hypothetical protein
MLAQNKSVHVPETLTGHWEDISVTTRPCKAQPAYPVTMYHRTRDLPNHSSCFLLMVGTSDPEIQIQVSGRGNTNFHLFPLRVLKKNHIPKDVAVLRFYADKDPRGFWWPVLSLLYSIHSFASYLMCLIKIQILQLVQGWRLLSPPFWD